jgi:putative transposase
LCLLFGITRQSYYQHFWHAEEVGFERQLVVNEVKSIRRYHPRLGGRKLYVLLEPFLLDHHIKIGRDALFDLLAENHLLVRKWKKKAITTNSLHRLRKYPNLVKDLKGSRPNQVWVSDITYWKIDTGFVYISFITDAFSHKIVGYHLANNLESLGPIFALKMAILTEKPVNLIHHSDRGIQYCCADYVKLLKENNILISMTENGDPRENAIAERVNGILKQEYLECYDVENIEQARKILSLSVTLYNKERPHMSIGNNTPELIHASGTNTEALWKNYYKERRDMDG